MRHRRRNRHWLAVLSAAAGFPAAAASIECPAVTVASLARSDLSQRDVLGDRSIPAAGKIGTEGAEPVGRLTIYGPILGSMDERNMGITMSCEPAGVRLVATITRSADYAGAVEKNILWRPLLIAAIVGRTAGASVTVEWRMRLSNGARVANAATPPYEAQAYPVIETVRLRARAGRQGAPEPGAPMKPP